MKHVLNLLKAGLLALLPLLLKAKLVAGTGGIISVVFPALAGLLGGNVLAVIGTALYWLELVVRVVPTAASYTPLTLLIQLLQAIVPNQATAPDGTSGEHVQGNFFKRIFSHPVAPISDPTPDPTTFPASSPDLAALQAQVSALVAHFTPPQNGVAY